MSLNIVGAVICWLAIVFIVVVLFSGCATSPKPGDMACPLLEVVLVSEETDTVIATAREEYKARCATP